MKKTEIILVLKRNNIERKIEKLNSNISSENKKAIRKIINSLKNELDLINYELEKTLGGNK